MRDLVAEDMKRTFRLGQIENEGNDPAKSGKSYGTPHDLATLYGTGRYKGSKEGPVPPGYDEKRPVGRPEEKASMINTQKDPLGKDRLGREENATLYTANIPDEGSSTPKGGSPLALAEVLRNKDMLKSIVFKDKQESTLLDEKNIRDI
jgi:hypothetical protein